MSTRTQGIIFFTFLLAVAAVARFERHQVEAERATAAEELRQEVREIGREVEEMKLRLEDGDRRLDRLEETTKGLRQEVDEIKTNLRKRGKMGKEAA